MTAVMPPVAFAREKVSDTLTLVRFQTPDLGVMETVMRADIANTPEESRMLKVLVETYRALQTTVREVI